MSIDEVLDKLIRDVEASVHAFYRGDVRQNTQRVRTESFRNVARDSLQAMIADGGDGGASAPRRSGAGPTLTRDEAMAATRCVMAWQPMGGTTFAVPEAKCIPAAREMMPTWGEREKARLALQRIAG
jgi:hypothetical protein